MRIENIKRLLRGSGFGWTDFGYWYALEDKQKRVVVCVGNNNGIYEGRCLLYNRITTQYKSYENELYQFGGLKGLADNFLRDCALKVCPRADEMTAELDEKYRIVWEEGRSEFERPYFLRDLAKYYPNQYTERDMMNDKFSAGDFLQAIFDEFRKIVREEIRAALKDAKNEPKKMYTRFEACKALHITQPTLWRWEREGVINGVRVNRRVLYSEDEINRVLKKSGKTV